jgi:hypothetical protein
MKKIIVAILMVVLFYSCTTTKYIEVPVDRVKIEYRDRTLIDTLIRNDSIVIREKGDTIFLEKYKYLYRTKEVRDTVNVTDTITTVKTVEVTKEINKLYTWQIVLMILGGSGIVLLIYKLINFIRK